MSSFNQGKVEIKPIRIQGDGHPAVIRNMKFKAGSGVIKAGTVVAKTDSDLIPWDGTNGKVKGIPLEDVDLSKASTGPVMVHGVGVRENIMVGNANITSAQEETLSEMGIWLS